MERKNAVYTIAEERSAEEARREHVLLVARNLAAGAAAALSDDFPALSRSVEKLQKKLSDAGVRLHIE